MAALSPAGMLMQGGALAMDSPRRTATSSPSAARMASADPAVGPGRYCPPRHPTYFEPSSLEFNANL